MLEEIGNNRRNFLRDATLGFVAAELASIGSSKAQAKADAKSFGPLQ